MGKNETDKNIFYGLIDIASKPISLEEDRKDESLNHGTSKQKRTHQDNSEASL